MLNVVAHTVFVFGCYLSLINFYFSFVRYPIFRLRGGNTDDYRSISAVPLLGSLLIVAALPFLDTIDLGLVVRHRLCGFGYRRTALVHLCDGIHDRHRTNPR